MGSGAWEEVLGLSRLISDSLLVLVCQALGWVLSTSLSTWSRGVFRVCCMWLGSGLKDGFCLRAWCQHQHCGARVTLFLHAPFHLLPIAVYFPPSQGSGPPLGAPVLVLRFSYICPDRKLRRYAVLEPEAHEAIQVLDPEAGGKSGGSRSQAGGLGSPCSSTCNLPAHS